MRIRNKERRKASAEEHGMALIDVQNFVRLQNELGAV